MSVIFAVFNRDGSPVETVKAEMMLESAATSKADDTGLWIEGAVAIGQAVRWNTPESRHETLPLVRDGVVLTMDARIDNREALATELDLPERPVEELGDSEFILSAYRKWGEACPAHLLGDFAFVIWDAKKRRLFCARDHMGIKSLYYAMTDEYIVVSNDIGCLVEEPRIDRQLDNVSIAVYFEEGQMLRKDGTFFRSIKPLSAATALTVEADVHRRACFWDIRKTPRIRLKNREAYARQLRALLDDAVRVRLRSDFPISSHLSGGLDSSAIAVLAARQLRLSNETIDGYNWIPILDESNPKAPEWGLSAEIAKRENIRHCSLRLSPENVMEIYASHNIAYNDTITFWYEYPVRRQMQKRASRVMLSGWGGDEFISNSGQGYVPGLFWRGGVIEALGILWRESLQSNRPVRRMTKKLYREILLPVLPRCLYHRALGSPCSSLDTFAYVKPKFSNVLKKEKPEARTIRRIGVRQEQISSHAQGYLQSRIAAWQRAGIVSGIEYRYPLLDKRVVEFALGIPEHLYRHDGRGRHIFRKAIADVLPENILWANNKHEPNRVQWHFRLLQNAQKMWKKNLGMDIPEDTIIDFKRLEADIDCFVGVSGPLSDSEMDRLSIIENSILFYNSRIQVISATPHYAAKPSKILPKKTS